MVCCSLAENLEQSGDFSNHSNPYLEEHHVYLSHFLLAEYLRLAKRFLLHLPLRMNQTRWPSRMLCLCASAWHWITPGTLFTIIHPVYRCLVLSFTPAVKSLLDHKPWISWGTGAEEPSGDLADRAGQYGCVGEQSGARKGATPGGSGGYADSGIFLKRNWGWIDMLMIFHWYQSIIVGVGINHNPNRNADRRYSIINAHQRRWIHAVLRFSGLHLSFAGWTPICFVCPTAR